METWSNTGILVWNDAMDLSDDDDISRTPPHQNLLFATPPQSPVQPPIEVEQPAVPIVEDEVLLLDSQHGGLQGGHMSLDMEMPSVDAWAHDSDPESPRERRGFRDQNVPRNIDAVNWHAELLNAHAEILIDDVCHKNVWSASVTVIINLVSLV